MFFYLAVLVVVWVVATAMVMKSWEEELDGDGEPEGDDWLMAVCSGLMIAIIWPVSMLAGGVFVAARGLWRKMGGREGG